MRIKLLSEFAGNDIQVLVVLVRGAGPHFSRNSSIPAGSIAQDNNPDEFLSPSSGQAK